MSKTRDNHYVPQWYQRGFLSQRNGHICYFDLDPDTKTLPDGRVITMNSQKQWPTSRCFYQTDLYTTFFGTHINDEIEKFLFGDIDNVGAEAVRAFVNTDPREWHENFSKFFSYIDSQKRRTPKGLDWIRQNYSGLNQVDLMVEMQSIRNLNCTLWSEGVREIVSATSSEIKFIISDHPITVYNHACPPDSALCTYPNDPSIALKASQTIYALDRDHCLILTNLEYASDPDGTKPLEKRTHAKLMRDSMVRTDKFIRTRSLDENGVLAINHILKSRARRYIAASDKSFLFPEQRIVSDWRELGAVLLPPEDDLYSFGGEMYVGYKDGSTRYQDAFGRSHPENEHLRKVVDKHKVGRNDPCGCGSGRKFKKCCEGKPNEERPSWDVYSIRERNLILYRAAYDIFGFDKGKSWKDLQRELSDEQIVKFHNVYWSLWPIETDIFSLLPRPNGSLRALYTGILDPRLITAFPLGTVPYFDEILVQHPFVHPKAVNPKFSPTENPHQHKFQMLKNLLLFMYLEPFVRSGAVNFIPDPCTFDSYLHREMLNMATARRDGKEMDENEVAQAMTLHRDDFERTMRGLPKDQLAHQIRQAMPEISQEKLDELIEYMREQNKQDPLSLLQDDLNGQDGQLFQSSMAPNFEMALFIAQVTGSAILTNSATRWDEIESAQYLSSGVVTNPWQKLTVTIGAQEFIMSIDPNNSIAQYESGNFGRLKKVFREVLNAASTEQHSPSESHIERLKSDFNTGRELAMKVYDVNGYDSFPFRMNFLLPKGGFANNNVQRLLLKSGSQHHRSSVPMAIFLEAIEGGCKGTGKSSN